MASRLRILIVEDSPDDAELIILQLKEAGFQLDWQRVETEVAYLAALDLPPDVILSDWSLPHFSGMRALKLQTERGLDTPFIIVSGSIGEDAAVDALRSGADDYVLKERPVRLGEAVHRALRDRESREEHRQAEAALRESEVRLAGIVGSAMDAIISVDATQHIVLFNPAAEQMFGCEASDALGQTISRLIPDRYRSGHDGHIARFGSTGVTTRTMGQLGSIYALRWDGREFPIEASISHTHVGGEHLHTVILRDITARKQAEEALKESERFAQATVNALSTHIAILDEAGTIIAVNQAWRTFAKANGPPGTDLHVCERANYLLVSESSAGPDADEASAIAAGIRAVMRGDQDEFSLEYPCHAPDEQRWFNVRVTRFPGDGALRVVVAHENITARKLAEAALRQQLAELEVLHTISSVLRMAETRVAALTCLLDETLAALNTNAGAIWLYHDESDELRVAVDRGWFAQVKQTSLRPDAGIGGSVFATGQTYISTEFRTDPRIDAALCAQAPPGWGGACLPLRIAGIKTVGVLYIAVPHARQIMAEQVKLLEALADMGGTTLQRIGLYEETVRQVDRLQSLRRIDEAIIASTDLRMSLSVVLDHVVAQLDVDAADILLLDPNAQTLSFAVGRGFRRDSLQHLRVRLGEGYAGLAALDRHLIYVPDLRQREIEFPRALLFMEERFVSYYVLPLIAKGQIKGVLEVFRRTPLAVGRDWVSFLETLAGQAAIAIDNAQLFEHLQRSNVNLALAYDATIEGWSRAMDLRDKETEGHTLRVTEVTERLAQAMGIDGAELVHIRRGALLHDIGKIGVPDGVLLKPGPLTDEEWVVMRQHPQLAYEMLAPISYLRLALDIPYCHHEKWDGTGYPRGLKGDQIPLSARLFAVVDVWDALRSDRPYRNGWPEERTLAHIRSLSGTHFDPKAVELFLQLRNETNAYDT